MKLLRLHVDHFGTLQNFDLSFDGGMNVLYQKNGWGKSTLAVFIKAMLYGLPATSKRSLDENERKKYLPWQGGTYGGSLELETAHGKFRIERTFGAKESGDTFSLFDLATNLPSTQYTSAIGEELFGIDVDGFERSTYLSQRALTGGKDNNSISAKLGNLLDDVGDIGNYDVAMEALDRRRRYYVMTGNRGAIATLEQEILARNAEFEGCQRKEEAMRAQEETLERLDAQLLAVRRASEENRERLKRAGLARERAALLERKQQMTAELTEMKEKKAGLHAYFDGVPPTPDELDARKRLLEQLNGTRAYLNMIPAEPDEALLRLRAKFPSGVPNEEDLARAERDQSTLRELRIRYESLQDARADVGLSGRFAQGVPSQKAIDRAFASLASAERMEREAEALSTREDGRRSALVPLAALFLALGVALAVLGFLPMLSAMFLPLLVGGAVSMAVGVILVIASARARAKGTRARIEAEKTMSRLKEQRALAMREVCELLAAYGMPTEAPARHLTELRMLAERYRENEQQIRGVTAQMQELNARREQVRDRLHAYLSRFLGGFAQKWDYAAELERLRRDRDALLQAEAAESKRASNRAEAERSLQEWKARLTPFLRKYDPTAQMGAGECLEHVAEQATEYRRLSQEIGRKREALEAFVREKALDVPSDTDDALEVDRLNIEARELQERVAGLERSRATAKSTIERLRDDVDRIPEIEGEILQLKMRLSEAKANADTIKATAGFLEEAKNALSTRYLGDMQESFGKLLSELIGGEAPEAVMNASFEVALRPDGGQTRSMESFSRGWRDAVELCVRLSLTEALYKEGEVPFLLLDDPFVNLDDDRLTAARALLDRLAERYQILYLVCHRDRI